MKLLNRIFSVALTRIYFLTAVCVALVGCGSPALKGGRAVSHGAVVQTLAQGENPAQASAQSQETVTVKSYTVPALSVIKSGPVSNLVSTVLAAAMPVEERTEVRAKTELGAAQKDTGREVAAKFKSLSVCVWVGLGVFVFGVVSAFYPPLKLVVASVTTSAALAVSGLALILLPSLVVGHELLILGGAVGAAGLWWFAHRHGTASASAKLVPQLLAKLAP